MWVLVLKHLADHLQTAPVPSDTVVRPLIAQGVAEIVHLSKAFPQKITKERNARRHTMDPDAIFSLIKFCVATGHPQYCADIFAKMRDAVRQGDFVPVFPPWKYYAALCATLSSDMETNPGFEATFRPFFIDAIDTIISGELTTAEGKIVKQCDLVYNSSALAKAARHASGIAVLAEKYDPVCLRPRTSR